MRLYENLSDCCLEKPFKLYLRLAMHADYTWLEDHTPDKANATIVKIISKVS